MEPLGKAGPQHARGAEDGTPLAREHDSDLQNPWLFLAGTGAPGLLWGTQEDMGAGPLPSGWLVPISLGAANVCGEQPSSLRASTMCQPCVPAPNSHKNLSWAPIPPSMHGPGPCLVKLSTENHPGDKPGELQGIRGRLKSPTKHKQPEGALRADVG